MTNIEQVIDEVRRATVKFPTWPTDPLHAIAILGEEFGELTKAMLQLTYEPHKTSAEEVHKEAVQTAAMALRIVMSLDRYEYAPSKQHEQLENTPDPKRIGRVVTWAPGIAITDAGEVLTSTDDINWTLGAVHKEDASVSRGDTPMTDAHCVSREYIEREMDRYTQKFVLADFARKLEREIAKLRTESKSLETRIAEAASDYAMGLQNDGFAKEYGGVDKLRDEMLALVKEWEGQSEDKET